MTSGAYTPTDVCDQGIAGQLGTPAAYLRKTREQKPGLYDANVNGWLEGDDRRFLLRCLRGAGGAGVARAFLSNIDQVIGSPGRASAALDGVRQSGFPVRVTRGDLTEPRCRSRIAGGVSSRSHVLARLLLAPSTGQEPYTGTVRAGSNRVDVRRVVLTNSKKRPASGHSPSPPAWSRRCGTKRDRPSPVTRRAPCTSASASMRAWSPGRVTPWTRSLP